jgi:hypothetical protein
MKQKDYLNNIEIIKELFTNSNKQNEMWFTHNNKIIRYAGLPNRNSFIKQIQYDIN